MDEEPEPGIAEPLEILGVGLQTVVDPLRAGRPLAARQQAQRRHRQHERT